MGVFSRRLPDPVVPRPQGGRAQRALVREVDLRHYRAAGFERVGQSSTYRRELATQAWLVVVDDLQDRTPVGRSFVGVGLHDEQLERWVAELVPGGRYDPATPSVLVGLPLSDDPRPERLQLRTLLLHAPGDGEELERQRTALVVETAQRLFGGLRTAAEIRREIGLRCAARVPGGPADHLVAALAAPDEVRQPALEALDPPTRQRVLEFVPLG